MVYRFRSAARGFDARPRLTRHAGVAQLSVTVLTLLVSSQSVNAQEPPALVAPPPVPSLEFRLNTTNAAARAAFDAGYAAILEFDYARAASEMARAYQADPRLVVARAFELTLRGRSPILADTIEALHRRNPTTNLVESLQLQSLRDRHDGLGARANLLLHAAARSAYTDARLLTEFHLWLGVGNATRAAIARSLRDANPGLYRSHAYVAMALPIADTAEAMTAMREAIRLGPTKPLSHYAAGELLSRLGRIDEAAAHYNHALQHDSAYYLARVGRAEAAIVTGRAAEARKDFEHLGQNATYAITVAVARRTAAITHLYEHNLDRALEEMTRVASQFESEGTWRTQLGLAHRHLAVLAALKKDTALVTRSIAAEKRISGDSAGVQLYWAAIARAVAGQPQSARAELAELERLIAAGQYTPAAGQMGAVSAMVLSAEKKYDEALTAAGNSSTNHWALIAGYQALMGLNRGDEARQRLQRLLSATNYASDAMAKPAAIYLYAR